jgi:hypothetical protein
MTPNLVSTWRREFTEGGADSVTTDSADACHTIRDLHLIVIFAYKLPNDVRKPVLCVLEEVLQVLLPC